MPDALILAAAEATPEVQMIFSGDAATIKVTGLSCLMTLLR
jgi:hypothetical protein